MLAEMMYRTMVALALKGELAPMPYPYSWDELRPYQRQRYIDMAYTMIPLMVDIGDYWR